MSGLIKAARAMGMGKTPPPDSSGPKNEKCKTDVLPLCAQNSQYAI